MLRKIWFLAALTLLHLLPATTHAQGPASGPPWPVLQFTLWEPPDHPGYLFESLVTLDKGNTQYPTSNPPYDDLYSDSGQYLGRVTVTASFNGGPQGTLTNAASGVTLVVLPGGHTSQPYVHIRSSEPSWSVGQLIDYHEEKLWFQKFALHRREFHPYMGWYDAYYHVYIGGQGIWTVKKVQRFEVKLTPLP